jgi:hypothetical protein
VHIPVVDGPAQFIVLPKGAAKGAAKGGDMSGSKNDDVEAVQAQTADRLRGTAKKNTVRRKIRSDEIL